MHLYGGELTDEVLHQLIDAAKDGFGSHMTDDDARNHILGAETLHIIRYDNELVGFGAYTTFRVLGLKVLYLGGIVLKEENQGLHLFDVSMERALRDEDPELLVMRTQNPVVYHCASRYVSAIYPNASRSVSRQATYERALAIAVGTVVAERLKTKSYDPETFACRNTYGRPLNDKIPEIRDSGATRVFDELKIDRQRGDSVLIVGFVKGVYQKNAAEKQSTASMADAGGK